MPHSQPDMGQKNNPKSKTLNPKATILGHAANTKGSLEFSSFQLPQAMHGYHSVVMGQKVKCGGDFLVFSSFSTIFHHNSDVLVQLSSSHIYSNGGVGALLGHGFSSHFLGGISPVALGNLCLRDESVQVHQRCYVHDRRKCLYSNCITFSKYIFRACKFSRKLNIKVCH